MPRELRPIAARLGLAPARESGTDLLRGIAGRIQVVAALTGIGMRGAARRTEHVLEVAAPDHLVVIGVAGGIGETVAIGDLIVPDQVFDLGTRASFRPAPLGSQPPLGTLASSDVLLDSPEEAQRLARQGVLAIDMETAAIAAVCQAHGCPWSVFRGVSDRADDGTTDAAVLGLVDAEGRPDPAALARFVLTRPHRIAQLVRLARGAHLATRKAADALATALTSL